MNSQGNSWPGNSHEFPGNSHERCMNLAVAHAWSNIWDSCISVLPAHLLIFPTFARQMKLSLGMQCTSYIVRFYLSLVPGGGSRNLFGGGGNHVFQSKVEGGARIEGTMRSRIEGEARVDGPKRLKIEGEVLE